VNGEHKITSSHRDRAALIYLRQSSMAQVREHTESTRSQYALADKAATLGWARSDIEVIDTDLGISGKWGVAREGFTELVTRMCRGDVGAIFGIEITRLARSNADVARLAEFARITGTLLIDPDGVYDPADVNDRVLLGFKGTLGEMELHVMAQRLQANKRAAAERGELRTPLPVGYVHDDAGDIVIDPDAGVQAAIRDVFAAFAACGSAYGVVAAFAGRRFPLRAYGGAWAGQLRWGRLTHARVLGVLKNPGYAGAYVFGRYASHRTVDPSGTVHTAMAERPRADWPVLIKDHHEGYITWAEYLASEARLAANHTAAGARPPREGTALCQGIIGCGSCGKPVMTNYHTDQRPAYECSSRRDRLTTPSCRSVAAACVDAAVASALLDALTPGQVVLALSAADEVAGRHQRASRAAELAVERARYDADRAERAFGQVEPENRLVARSLEARWEARLAALAEAEQALQAAQDVPPLPSRDDLEKLAADLPALWNAPTTSARDRKRLLRTLIADVTVLPEPDRSKVRIGIRWHTGATDELTADRPVHPGTAKRTPAAAVELVKRLGPTTSNDDLVTRLNAAGHLTGHGRPFDIDAVQWIRHAYKIQIPDPCGPGEISVAEAARRLGCSTGVIYHWIRTGQLTARRGSASRFCIPWNAQAEAGCRTRIAQSAHLGRAARPRTLPAPAFPAADGGEVSVTEAACRLGCSTGVIYYWIQTGQLSARRGSGNRLHIPWDDQIQAECSSRIGQSGHLNPAARRTKPRRRR
jgi:DNA invertase Pin-like site-specific DNA recombinase